MTEWNIIFEDLRLNENQSGQTNMLALTGSSMIGGLNIWTQTCPIQDDVIY